jgi:hypothetical protein
MTPTVDDQLVGHADQLGVQPAAAPARAMATTSSGDR